MLGRKGDVRSWWISEYVSEWRESESFASVDGEGKDGSVVVVVVVIEGSGKKMSSGPAEAVMARRHRASYRASRRVMRRRASLRWRWVRMGMSVRRRVW